ncbi:hypothetical protein SUDANB105_07850 [Streptomyces sp. enrichment culture]|uniref:NACHT domain-containing protein n=1 Tax=Streptomyces sp. enrichment culture TaxID=1795815 RepID=UPI003F55FC4D
MTRSEISTTGGGAHGNTFHGPTVVQVGNGNQQRFCVHPGQGSELEGDVRSLATQVHTRCANDAKVLGLRGPAELNVGYRVCHWPGDEAAAEDGRADLVPPDVCGDVRDIADLFQRAPSRQLVVTGEPGSGKSALAMLLSLGLLEEWRLTEPVPVILALSSWRPDKDSFDTWLEQRITEDYPFLKPPRRYGARPVIAMLAKKMITPVLDGLDEVPEALRGVAARAIAKEMDEGRSLVVTCRSAEYRRHAVNVAHTMSGVARIELQPLPSEKAIDFLIGGSHRSVSSWPAEHHWSLVKRELGRHSPLAHVMTSPLMVSLVRELYQPQDPPDVGEPVSNGRSLRDLVAIGDESSAEHSDPGRATGPEPAAFDEAVDRLRAHLLEGLIVRAYPQGPLAPGIEPARWHWEQARAWLAFLARQLRRNGDTHDICWWRLRDAVPQPVRVAIVGAVAAGLAAIAWRWWMACGFGLAFGLAAGLPTQGPGPRHALGWNRLRSSRPGSGTRRLLMQLGPRVLEQAMVGAALGLIVGMTTGSVAWLVGAPLIGAMAGGAVGATSGMSSEGRIPRMISPLQVLRADRAIGLRLGLLAGGAAGLATAVASASRVPTGMAMTLGCTIALAVGFGAALTVAVLLGTLAGGLITNVRVDGAAEGTLTVMLFAGCCSGGLAVGRAVRALSGFAVCAWWQWVLLSRTWLPLTRRLPWSVMSFLADAHKRGLLRRVGPVYEFRHALLRDHLASTPRTPMRIDSA